MRMTGRALTSPYDNELGPYIFGNLNYDFFGFTLFDARFRIQTGLLCGSHCLFDSCPARSLLGGLDGCPVGWFTVIRPAVQRPAQIILQIMTRTRVDYVQQQAFGLVAHDPGQAINQFRPASLADGADDPHTQSSLQIQPD
jgi:hypothetical protein